MMDGKKIYAKSGSLHASSLDILCNFVVKFWNAMCKN